MTERPLRRSEHMSHRRICKIAKRIYHSRGDRLSLTVAAIGVILLSGCVTTQPDAIKISIPVPVPCITADQLPKPADVRPDSELAKLDDAKLILTIAAERLDLKRYAAESSALLSACVK